MPHVQDAANRFALLGLLNGGLETAVRNVVGGELAWVSDIDPGACKILNHHWPNIPNLGDITTIDWSTVEPVDVITGGSPCQDLSHAGRRAGMTEGTRSGLWSHMAAAINHLRPSLVVIENVRGLLSARADCDVEPCPWCLGDTEAEPPLSALGAVLGELADLGFDAAWHGLSAASVGACHGRFRVFLIAWPQSADDGVGRIGWPRISRPGRRGQPTHNGDAVTDTDSKGLAVRESIPGDPCAERAAVERSDQPATHADSDGLEEFRRLNTSGCDIDRRNSANQDAFGSEPSSQWGQFEPVVRRWATVLGRPAPAPTETGPKGGARLSARAVEFMMGLPDGHVTDVPGLSRNDQLRCLGNGVVPQQAEAAIRILLNSTQEARSGSQPSVR